MSRGNARLLTRINYLIRVQNSKAAAGRRPALRWVAKTSRKGGRRSSQALVKNEPAANQLERFKKYCGHLERGFLGFGEALAKEHVWEDL